MPFKWFSPLFWNNLFALIVNPSHLGILRNISLLWSSFLFSHNSKQHLDIQTRYVVVISLMSRVEIDRCKGLISMSMSSRWPFITNIKSYNEFTPPREALIPTPCLYPWCLSLISLWWYYVVCLSDSSSRPLSDVVKLQLSELMAGHFWLWSHTGAVTSLGHLSLGQYHG